MVQGQTFTWLIYNKLWVSGKDWGLIYFYFFGRFWMSLFNLLLFLKGNEKLKTLVDLMLRIVTGVRKSSWRTNRMGKCHFKFMVTEIHTHIYIVHCLLVSWYTGNNFTVVPPLFLLLKLYFILKEQSFIPLASKGGVRAVSWPESTGWSRKGQAGGDEQGPNFPRGASAGGTPALHPLLQQVPARPAWLTGCTKK